MKRAGSAFLLTLLATVPAACRIGSEAPSPSHSAPSPLVAARPFRLDVPASYDARKPAPLLLALHGYGAVGDEVGSAHWGVSAIANAHGAFVAHPDGTLDRSSRRFWNATDACCDFEHTNIDDVAYLTAVIDDVAARYVIDPKRVWVAGISNGGFMAHRLACDRADKVAAIVSLAGAGWAEPSRCPSGAPVSVLEVHGLADAVILYDGGTAVVGRKMASYPSVDSTVAFSAAEAGCTGALAPGESRGAFDGDNPRVATETSRWTGCPQGIDVELWKMPGAKHVPDITPAGSETIVSWLEGHPKHP